MCLVLGASACASNPVKDWDSDRLLAVTCRTGANVTKASGDVWIKVASRELSGQFSAAAEVVSPGKLDIEVTNPLGGTEASIRIKDAQMLVSEKKGDSKKWFGAWNGIPVQFAVDLFLGRIPCPVGELRKAARTWIEGDTLLVRVEAKGETLLEEYRYQFRSVDGVPWAKTLVWKKHFGGDNEVAFVFEDPESITRSPLYWRATTSVGDLAVNWRDRRFDTGIGVR